MSLPVASETDLYSVDLQGLTGDSTATYIANPGLKVPKTVPNKLCHIFLVKFPIFCLHEGMASKSRRECDSVS